MDQKLPDRRALLGLGAGAAAMTLLGCRSATAGATPERFAVTMTDAQWQAKLGGAAFGVLRREGTEAPFTSPLNNEHRVGLFHCKGCDLPVFSSKTKFDSGTGWPSFWQPLANAVATRKDFSIGVRDEVHCRRCGGHLGHVFDDGPKPTGLRYCMNGVAMTFTPGGA